MSGWVCRASRMRLKDAFIVLACCLIVSGNSIAADAIYHLDLAPDTLTSALDLLARQTQLEFIYSADELAGLKTRGLHGDFSAQQAVKKLLKGTDLVVKVHESGAILITRGKQPSDTSLISNDRRGVRAPLGSAEEVIVTASRRPERLSQVAGTVSTVSGMQLEELGANQLADYVGFLPGVGTQSLGHAGYETIFMRGIAPLSVGATISTYVDDVPVGPSSALTRGGLNTLDLEPTDLARIEAVKGPQGTLYGASSMGGVLKYVTRNPDLSDPELHVYEAFDLPQDGSAGLTLRATGSLPLIQDALAVRVGGFLRHEGGYLDDVGIAASDVNRTNDRGFRATLLYRPFDALTLKIAAMAQSRHFAGNDVVDYDLGTGRPLLGTTSYSRNAREPAKTELQLYSAELDYHLRWFDLIAASSYSTSRPRQVVDTTQAMAQRGFVPPASSTPAASLYVEPSEKFTQEIRLLAPRLGRLEWMLGGFFQRERLDAANYFFLSDADGHAIAPLLGEAHRGGTLVERAGFANATLYLTESLDVTAGVRISNLDQTRQRRAVGAFFNPANPLAQSVSRQAFSETPTTWLAAARWRPATDITLYARAASGYRPGGGRSVPPDAPPGLSDHYHSDSLWSYETGLKLHAFRERLDVDLAGFWIDWEHIQTAQPAGSFLVDGNAGSARSRGVELETRYSSPLGFEVLANCAFTDATFTESIPAIGITAGAPLAFVPRWTATLSPSYSRNIGQHWRLQIASDLQHQASRLDINRTALPAFSIWNARIALNDDRFRVAFYVWNITNKQALLGSGGEAVLASQYGFAVNAPRTIGIAFTQDFTGAR